MCQWGANIDPWAGYRMGLSQTPPIPNQAGGVKKSPFQIAAKRLEIDKNEHNRSDTLWL